MARFIVLDREVIENTKENPSMTKITMMLDGAGKCVFAHSYADQIVYVGVGTVQRAYDPDHFCPVLIMRLLNRLSEGETCDVDVTIITNGHATDEEARSVRDSSIIALKPVWQEAFDLDRYKAENPRILCVQTGAVYNTAYEASKALDLSIPTVYNMIDRPPSFSATRKGLQFVRTSKPATTHRAVAGMAIEPGEMSFTDPTKTLADRLKAVPRSHRSGLIALENEARRAAGLPPITP